MRKVSISSCRVGPLCGETVYINDYRVCGMKPSGSENVTFSASADVSEIFKAINKNLSIEDLKQNEHVKGLLETLERLSHYELYSSAIDRGVYKETRTAQGQLDILTDAARARLKEWEDV